MERTLKEILRAEGSIEIDDREDVLYGRAQACFELAACDALWELADRKAADAGHESILRAREDGAEGWYNFYAALDGYSESHVDPAINVTVNFPGSRSDGECIAIPLDREEQGLLFGILDRECRKLYGKTAMEIIDEAVNEEFDETARGWE